MELVQDLAWILPELNKRYFKGFTIKFLKISQYT